MDRQDDQRFSPPATALDWEAVHSVFLDLDGTLLDLHFDNFFWGEHLPRRYAEIHGLSPQEAHELLHALYAEKRGHLDWYCLDHWRKVLRLDIVALKEEVAHLIAVHAHVPEFLSAMRASGRRVVLVTNAHRDSVNLKFLRTGLEGHFDRVISSHDLGHAKEHDSFWNAFARIEPHAPAQSLMVDDNLDVLRAADRHGIAHLRAVRQPDSRRAVLESDEYPAITDFRELMP